MIRKCKQCGKFLSKIERRHLIFRCKHAKIKFKKKCLYCKKEFEVHNHRKDTAKFCSRYCSDSYQFGKKHHCWSRVKVRCKECGRIFEVTRTKAKKVQYCSHKCYWNFIKNDKFCLECGIKLNRYQRRYCSKKCYGLAERGKIPHNKGRTDIKVYGKERAEKIAWIKRKKMLGRVSPMKGRKHSEETKKKMGLLGKDNPAWIHGQNRYPYPSIKVWKKIKKDISKRDNYLCQYCSAEGDRPHHINYIPSFNDYSNLIWVCRTCNSKFNTNRDFWFAYWCTKLKIEPEELVGKPKNILILIKFMLKNLILN